jgi:tripartite-type tricarboxylate transporter receptor subunit TctC
VQTLATVALPTDMLARGKVTEAAVSNQDGAVVLVEPFGAGGGVDVVARPLAAELAEILKARVTVDNRPGEGATAAPAFVARAPPDGRTLLINTSAHAYSAMFAAQLPYDPIEDFVPIAPVTSQPYVLVASARSGLRMLDGLVDAARARAAELTFISAGVGTGTHLSVEQLNRDLGVRAIHVPARPATPSTPRSLASPRETRTMRCHQFRSLRHTSSPAHFSPSA